MNQLPPSAPTQQRMSGCSHALSGRSPRNKGRSYPADPPPVEEIIAVMRSAGRGPSAERLRALIVLLLDSAI